jgi:hypothetical protein
MQIITQNINGQKLKDQDYYPGSDKNQPSKQTKNKTKNFPQN